jgi:hypothetical protein
MFASYESIIKGELQRAARRGVGLRKRDMFPVTSSAAHNALYSLLDAGLVREERHRDPANMEDYCVYYWVGK